MAIKKICNEENFVTKKSKFIVYVHLLLIIFKKNYKELKRFIWILKYLTNRYLDNEKSEKKYNFYKNLP